MMTVVLFSGIEQSDADEHEPENAINVERLDVAGPKARPRVAERPNRKNQVEHGRVKRVS